VSWTDLLGLHKNICKKAEVVPIALKIAKPAYGITLHSREPEEYTANKKKHLDGDKTGSGVYVSSAHNARWR
jgi:hypothetical protein